MQRRACIASVLALIAAACARSDEGELPTAPPETVEWVTELAAPRYAGAGMSGLPVLARSAFLDRASMIRLLDAVYGGTDAASGFIRHQASTYSVNPMTAFRNGEFLYLLIGHAQDEEYHAAPGYFSVYVFNAVGETLVREFPFFVSGGDWGGQEFWGSEPDVSVVPLPDGAVLILLSQSYQQQGYESEWEDVLLIEADSAREAARIDTFSSSEGAAVGEMPFEVERLIGAELRTDGRSIQLQYNIEHFTGSEFVPSGRAEVYQIDVESHG